MRGSRRWLSLVVLSVPLVVSAQQSSAGIAGHWKPRDPAKAEALFAVGLSDITRAGMQIEQRGDTLAITRNESDDALARMQEVNGWFEAQSVYALDASRSAGATKYYTSGSGSASWDGRQLVVENASPYASWHITYTLEGGTLKTVMTSTRPSGAGNTVVLYYQRIDR